MRWLAAGATRYARFAAEPVDRVWPHATVSTSFPRPAWERGARARQLGRSRAKKGGTLASVASLSPGGGDTLHRRRKTGAKEFWPANVGIWGEPPRVRCPCRLASPCDEPQRRRGSHPIGSSIPANLGGCRSIQAATEPAPPRGTPRALEDQRPRQVGRLIRRQGWYRVMQRRARENYFLRSSTNVLEQTAASVLCVRSVRRAPRRVSRVSVGGGRAIPGDVYARPRSASRAAPRGVFP
jgi:hypothetical protein